MVDQVFNTHVIENKFTQSETPLGYRVLKRVFDIVISFLALIMLAPGFLVIAILIKREGPGPVLYRGPRVGRNGKLFGILKFRTMYERLESYQGSRVTAKDDPRITPLGHWLRNTKINELPQLWNVLIGDMSLVGPRPEDPKLAEAWDEEVRAKILSVRPGITSPASVLYRNEEQLLQRDTLLETYFGDILPSKLRLEQLYVRHHSFLMDMDILFWTIIALFPGRSTVKVPEDSLFWGPLSRLMRRYASWFLLDAITTFIAFALVGGLWRLVQPLDVGWFHAIGAALGFSMIFSLVGAAAGVQKIEWSKARAEDVFYLIPSTLLAGIITFGINYYFKIFPLRMIVVITFISLIGFVSVRYRQRLITGPLSRWLTWRKDANLLRERVLIVGSGDAGRMAAWMIENIRDARALRVVGYIDDDLYKQRTRISGIEVLGKRENIPDIVQRYDVGLIIYAIHNIAEHECKAILQLCRQSSARLAMMPNVLGLFTTKVPGSSVRDSSNDRLDLDLNPITCQKLESWLSFIENELGNNNIAAALDSVKQMKSANKSKDFTGGKL